MQRKALIIAMMLGVATLAGAVEARADPVFTASVTITDATSVGGITYVDGKRFHGRRGVHGHGFRKGAFRSFHGKRGRPTAFVGKRLVPRHFVIIKPAKSRFYGGKRLHRRALGWHVPKRPWIQYHRFGRVLH